MNKLVKERKNEMVRETKRVFRLAEFKKVYINEEIGAFTAFLSPHYMKFYKLEIFELSLSHMCVLFDPHSST